MPNNVNETPKPVKPPEPGAPRKPAEDSFFAERDVEIQEEKKPHSTPVPRPDKH